MKNLIKAIREGNIDLVDKLLKERNLDGENGTIALHVAIEYRRTEIMEMLLNSGANKEAKDKDGNTSLHIAVKHAIVYKLLNGPFEYLIDNGADVNAQNSSGRTPLFIAAARNNKRAMTKLIGKDANVNVKDNNGNTILHASVPNKQAYHEERHWAALELLINEFDLETTNNDGKTILHIASEYSSPEILEILLDQKANKEAKDKYGNTPLHLSAKRRFAFDNMKTLLDRGADKEVRNNNGKTPLSIVIGKGGNQKEVIFFIEKEVILLIDHGAKTDDLTVDEKNKLDQIVKLYKNNPLKFLKDNNADDDWIKKSLSTNIALYQSQKLCMTTMQLLESKQYKFSDDLKKFVRSISYYFFEKHPIKFLEMNHNTYVINIIEKINGMFLNSELLCTSINYVNSIECKFLPKTKSKLLNTLKMFSEENFIKHLSNGDLSEKEIVRIIGLRNSNFFNKNLDKTIRSIAYINSDDCKLSKKVKDKLLIIIEAKCPKAFENITESIGSHVERLVKNQNNSNNNEYERGGI